MTEAQLLFLGYNTLDTRQPLYTELHTFAASVAASQAWSTMHLCFKRSIDNLCHGNDSLILLTLSHKLQSDRCIFERFG